MKQLAATLNSQVVQNNVREVGINPNYWYAVGWADKLKIREIIPIVIWSNAIAIYRDENGQIHALEDACPHKGVALHKGKVTSCNLACAYHGWEFNGDGDCVSIPYLPETQKLPRARARSYPVVEKYNLIWVFPGDPALADAQNLLDIPELNQKDWFVVPLAASFQAHFSICNENTMDVFHGFLHQKLQGWFDPVLVNLSETESAVCADYQVSYRGWIAKFLGLSEKADQVTTLPVAVQYHYPNYYTTLQGVSSLYLFRLPVSPTESKSFALFFFKVRLPQSILKPLQPLLQKLLRRLVLEKFLSQDIEMIESEQRTYNANRSRRYVEINPAIIAIQRLIVRQYEQFLQQSSQNNDKFP